MSDTKFTKGPWNFEHDDSTSSLIQIFSESEEAKGDPDICRLQHEPDAHLITAAPEMYEMLQSARSEIYQLIDEVNDQRASRITSMTEDEPDYHDQETVYLIDKLLAKARGES